MGKCGRKEVEKDQIMSENKISDSLVKPEHINICSVSCMWTQWQITKIKLIIIIINSTNNNTSIFIILKHLKVFNLFILLYLCLINNTNK